MFIQKKLIYFYLADRDNYITVNYQNIQTSIKYVFTFLQQFFREYDIYTKMYSMVNFRKFL